jgi:fucose permease
MNPDFFDIIKPFVTPIHGLIGGIGVGATIATDVLFFEFIRDCKISALETRYAKILSKVFWAALIGLFVTGILITLSDPVKYLHSAKFLTKMVAVLVITINGLILNFVITPALTKLTFCDDQDPKLERIKQIAFMCGAISFSSWPLAFILGSISKIPLSPTVGITTYIGLLVVAGLASQTVYFIRRQQR